MTAETACVRVSPTDAPCVITGCAADELRELRKREKEQGIQSNWEIDSFMAADTLEGKREAIVSEYILRILGLDVRNQLRHRLSCFAVHFPFLSHSVLKALLQ